jgi:hypothetical protein
MVADSQLFRARAQLTLARQSETVPLANTRGWTSMKRIVTVALWSAFAGFLLPGASAQAQTSPAGLLATQAPKAPVTDLSAQSRRPLRRVPIYRNEPWETPVYPRYNPGPNAVRDCTATYVQEYRPSGTVITPRMNCYWRPG